MTGRKCYLCGIGGDLRPYGPKGQDICFRCATKPENENEAKRQFRAQIEAAEKASDVVIVGEDTGPRPMNNRGKKND